jgi:ferritin-like metal-binding protein YciE
MSLQTMDELLEEQINDMYSAEKQLLKALPKMANAAHSQELKTAFENHLHETEEQINRLDQVFERLEIKPVKKTCKGMAGLIKEGEEIIAEEGAPQVKDAALIAAAQKVEHYEISAYGTMCELADELADDDVKNLLGKNLASEKKTDKALTKIATTGALGSSLKRKAEQGE